MQERPTLTTPRTLLRPFDLADAPDVHRLAGERAIASTTQNIPHPYEAGMAEQWIGTHQERYEQGSQVTLAIVLRADNVLMGGIGLRLNPSHSNAELGYWLGVPYWNHGYGTKAAHAVVAYGFEVLGLHRIHAAHMTRNPASGRIMQKIGMTHESHLRQHVNKWGVCEDMESYPNTPTPQHPIALSEVPSDLALSLFAQRRIVPRVAPNEVLQRQAGLAKTLDDRCDVFPFDV